MEALASQKSVVVGKSPGFRDILNQNKSDLQRIEQFKNKKISVAPRNVLFVGMALGTLLLFIMFAGQIISGVFALVITVLFAISAYFGLRFLKAADPLIKQKTKNMVLKKMVEEARENAVQQLDNQILENSRRLRQARQARENMGAAVAKLRSKINPANQGKPSYQMKIDMLAKVEAAYEQIKDMLEKAAVANKKFEEKVIQYKDMESFARDVQQAMSMFESTAGMQLGDMLSLEAFGQIEEDFNVALVSIENQTRDMQLEAA